MNSFWRVFHSLSLLLALASATKAFADENPWQRVVVIGASASAGFVLSEPFGGTNTDKCKLHRYLDAAIIPPHAPVKNLATSLMFMNPDALAAMQVEAATNAQPTLVVAVDFLFWFCYGDVSANERAGRFEEGLKLLERIPCPLVVGDIPDMSSATNTGIIGVDQLPGEATRLAANKRLKEWAAAHPRVAVVPLAEFMRATRANAAIKLHNGTLPAGKSRALMQNDMLHPNPQGATILALGILDSLTARQKSFPAKNVHWDADKVLREGLKLAQPKS